MRILLLFAAIIIVLIFLNLSPAKSYFQNIFNLNNTATVNTEATPTTTVEESEAITIDKISESPSVYENLEVSLPGIITDWVTKRSFVLSDENFSASSILVINNSNFSIPDDTDAQIAIGEAAKVEVTGVVRKFDLNAFEREMGVDLKDDALEKYKGEMVIMATGVQELGI